jgi:hypothetical protein
MTDPNNPDDNWGELYRELGVDDPGLPKPSEDDAEVIELTESGLDEVGETAQPFGEDGADEIEEPAEGETVTAEGEGEGEGEGEPGQKRRRRRRRRRKKKGGAGQPAGEEAVGSDSESEESETQLEEEEDGGEAITGPGVEEEVTPEMTRDIIANWNVPSWEEIVAGLHRPDR